MLTRALLGSCLLLAACGGDGGTGETPQPKPVASITVSPPALSLLVGQIGTLSAQAKDASGLVLSGRTITWSSSDAVIATVSNAGVVTGAAVGTAIISAASEGKIGAATVTVSPVPAPTPEKLGFAVQPTLTEGTQPIGPAPQVAIQDALGNTVSNATGAVTVSLGTNASGATLGGTKTVNVVNGVATFDGLTIDRPGSGYTLVATSGTLLTATSATFAIRLTFTGVGSGAGATCGVTTASAAYCWGSNFSGELGDGTTTNRASPVLVAGGLRFAAVASSGGDHSCGVTAVGAAYCWGYNGRGQLGDGSAIDRSSPVLVASGLSFPAVGPAGGDFSCGVTATGAAYCWGANDGGQLGDGTTLSRTSPVLVTGGLTFAGVSGGRQHACGVTTIGAAYCWGFNFAGLGDGATSSQSSPVPVSGGLMFAAVSTKDGHTCGVTTAGAAYCWGDNDRGQLGDATTLSRSSPVLIGGGLALAAVSAGGDHTCGVTPAGAAYCWGYNFFGALGDGTATSRTSPTPVAGGLSFATISAGRNHTCGVTTAGATYCWGENDQGQLGNGTTNRSFLPVRVVQ